MDLQRILRNSEKILLKNKIYFDRDFEIKLKIKFFFEKA